MLVLTRLWSVSSAPFRAEQCPGQTFRSSVLADTRRHFPAWAGEPWLLIRQAQTWKKTIPSLVQLPCFGKKTPLQSVQQLAQSPPCTPGVCAELSLSLRTVTSRIFPQKKKSHPSHPGFQVGFSDNCQPNLHSAPLHLHAALDQVVSAEVNDTFALIKT